MSVAAIPSWRLRYPVLQVAPWLVCWVLVLYAATFLSMASIWSRDATFAHGFAIPLISLWLLWQRRERLAALPVVPAPQGLWCCAGLMSVWLLADLAGVQVIAQAAATALLPAALWAGLGGEFLRRAAFPLAYLAFAVPWGDIFVPTLMRFTTEFTVAAVRLVGVPIFREGNLFSLPSGNFEVVKACSGVRYLIASLALGTLYAGITYRSWRRQAAFIGLSIVVPIIANGLRAFGIVMIAHWSKMEYAVGLDHLIYGWLFFGVVMALLFWIGNRFIEPADVASSTATAGIAPPQPGPRALWPGNLWLVFGVLGAGVAAKMLLTLVVTADPASTFTRNLPAGSADWRGPSPLQDEWRPAFVEKAQTIAAARYDAAQGRVLLFARDYLDGEPETALTSRALVAQEQGPWRVTQVGVAPLALDLQVRAVQLANNDGTHLEVWIWMLVNGQPTDQPLRATWLQLRSWLTLKRPLITVVAVAAPGLQGAQARSLLSSYLQQYPQLLGTSAVSARASLP